MGSSSFITNLEGEVVQHLEYVPFGEVFIESKNARWNTPYKFNAKELDEETGLYYYGARYYNPRISLWLSVDPLWEEVGAHRSPYEYTYSNPIMFTDPTGMGPEWVPKVNSNGSITYVAEKGDTVDTFADQYGISREKAKELIGSETVIAGVTSVSGDQVYEMNPYGQEKSSPILKLNLTSNNGKRDQNRLDQFLFAVDYTKNKEKYSFLTGDFYTKRTFASAHSLGGNGTIGGFGSIIVDGEKIDIVFNIPMARVYGDNNHRLGISVNKTQSTVGRSFPNQFNAFFSIYHPKTKNQNGLYQFYLDEKDSNKFLKRFE
ncbi:MAG: RHS repeat-associated core domain-containing protein [Flavobacteriaceae bacterium]|nr:RHS repeat-associated core domain-containing protein [Flavobacteriaceae bacterium]